MTRHHIADGRASDDDEEKQALSSPPPPPPLEDENSNCYDVAPCCVDQQEHEQEQAPPSSSSSQGEELSNQKSSVSLTQPSQALSPSSLEGASPPQHVIDAWEWYAVKHNSPKFWVAPLVGLSDKAFRILCRRYGATMAHTEMIDPGGFSKSHYYRSQMLNMVAKDEKDEDKDDGSNKKSEASNIDRPLVLQLGGSDITKLIAAIQVAVSLEESYGIDAVELNCGCPQLCAKRGKYGSFLLDPENQSLLLNIISKMRQELPQHMPLLVKMRVLESIEDSVELAKRIVQAGAGILTVHGRTRYQGGGAKTKGQDGERLASWPHIKAVKDAVSCPVISNGNVPNKSAIHECLKATGCDGVMSGCGILGNPKIFSTSSTATSPKESNIKEDKTYDDDWDWDWDWDSAVKTSVEYIKLAIQYRVHPTRVSKHLIWILERGPQHIRLKDSAPPELRKRILDLRYMKPMISANVDKDSNGYKRCGMADILSKLGQDLLGTTTRTSSEEDFHGGTE